MKKNTFLIAICFFLCAVSFNATAQKYITTKSSVLFFSKAAIENITAKNTKATGIFNVGTGEIAFSIPNKEFQFAKSLMKDHFNEKYMETEQNPKSTFQGKVSGYDLNIEGAQNASASGKLSIHGVTQEVDIKGTLEKQSDKLILKSKFMVQLKDYNITIPQLFWRNIAEQVEVTIEFTFKPQ